ncbi:hypothetical protein [Chloroflexus sp.]|nr:hypothetical protein [uncultured Chloroflexus sp.]
MQHREQVWFQIWPAPLRLLVAKEVFALGFGVEVEGKMIIYPLLQD